MKRGFVRLSKHKVWIFKHRNAAPTSEGFSLFMFGKNSSLSFHCPIVNNYPSILPLNLHLLKAFLPLSRVTYCPLLSCVVSITTSSLRLFPLLPCYRLPDGHHCVIVLSPEINLERTEVRVLDCITSPFPLPFPLPSLPPPPTPAHHQI